MSVKAIAVLDKNELKDEELPFTSETGKRHNSPVVCVVSRCPGSVNAILWCLSV